MLILLTVSNYLYELHWLPGGSASTVAEKPHLYGEMQWEGGSPSRGSAVPDADLEVT